MLTGDLSGLGLSLILTALLYIGGPILLVSLVMKILSLQEKKVNIKMDKQAKKTMALNRGHLLLVTGLLLLSTTVLIGVFSVLVGYLYLFDRYSRIKNAALRNVVFYRFYRHLAILFGFYFGLIFYFPDKGSLGHLTSGLLALVCFGLSLLFLFKFSNKK